MNPQPDSKRDFFISYNHADKGWAEWTAWQLEDNGYSTILQAWDFKAGSNFVLQMHQALQEAERMISVLSQNYLDAIYTQPEWAAFFGRDPKGEKGLLVPVRVQSCHLEGLLAPIVYIDLVGLDEPEAKNELLQGIKRGRVKPKVKSPYPGFPAVQRSITERPRFPGALPEIWNVPHRNRNFTGRGKLLSELRNALTAGQPAALTQAIHGLGGVGKTQLALEYSYRCAPDYILVWWVRAEEPAKLAADYAGLAMELNLKEKEEKDQKLIVAAVKRWFQQNRNWLLVFDNAREQCEVRDYIPQGATGHVIVTSRNPNWAGLASPLAVPVLKRTESVDFLLKRTVQQDRQAAEALAEALGDLPLALEQAAAYMENSGRSLKDYIKLFKDNQAELLKTGFTSTEYSATVATTWGVNFQKVNEESLSAAQLLNLCAFLAPDDIPKTLFAEGVKILPQPLSATVKNQLKFDKVIATLRKYSLVQVAEDAFSVHRLVQAVTHDKLNKKEWETWASAAVKMVNTSFPHESDDVRTWPICSRLLPHGLAVTARNEAGKLIAETGTLLNQMGLYVWGRADLSQAKNLFQRALAIGQKTLGPDHPNQATRLNNLAGVLKDQGDLKEAKEFFQRALAIDKKTYGPNDLEVAIDLNNLASVLKDQGKIKQAKKLFQRALAIAEKTLEPEHPRVATALNNLAVVLQDQGDLKQAKELYRRALSIDEKTLGPDHPDVATRLNNLASVLQDQGKLKQAKELYQRALKILCQFLGENHPNTITARKNLELLNTTPDSKKPR